MTGPFDVTYYKVPTMDLFTFYNDICGCKLSVRDGCGNSKLDVFPAGPVSDTRHWRHVTDIMAAWGSGKFASASILAVGSPFRMASVFKIGSDGHPWLQDVLARIKEDPIPFSRSVLTAAERVARAIHQDLGSFTAFHFRLPDGVDPGVKGAIADPVQLHASWALMRLKEANVPEKSRIYVASNLHDGCKESGLRDLCSKYQCFCLAGSSISEHLLCEAGLCGNVLDATNHSLSALTGMPRPDLMAMIDKQVCVLADRGFWAQPCHKECKDEQCPPPPPSNSFAADIISRRSVVCKASCAANSMKACHVVA